MKDLIYNTVDVGDTVVYDSDKLLTRYNISGFPTRLLYTGTVSHIENTVLTVDSFKKTSIEVVKVHSETEKVNVGDFVITTGNSGLMVANITKFTTDNIAVLRVCNRTPPLLFRPVYHLVKLPKHLLNDFFLLTI